MSGENIYLISEKIGIEPQPYSDEMARLPYPEQVAATGIAFFPKLVENSVHIATATSLLDRSIADHTPLGMLPNSEPAHVAYYISRIIFNGANDQAESSDILPFVLLRDEIMEKLAQRGLPAAPDHTASHITPQCYPVGGGIIRHGDQNPSLEHPIAMLALDQNRVYELITPAGQLLYIASQIGDIIVAPQRKGLDAHRRPEHAVAATAEHEYAKTVQFSFSNGERYVNAPPPDPRDVARWSRALKALKQSRQLAA